MKAIRTITALRPTTLPRLIWRQSRAKPGFLDTYRRFHTAAILRKTQTHILSDIGEGVKEVQIIQWFVEEGAAVEEWAPLCEVQSDKASVEITSKYTGVVKKLHFDRDAIVQVGDAMLDIDVEGEADREEHEEPEVKAEEGGSRPAQEEPEFAEVEPLSKPPGVSTSASVGQGEKLTQKGSNIATPAVRGLLKEHSLEITDITGTGKDGRVLKEDVYKHLESRSPELSAPSPSTARQKPELDAKQVETKQSFTAIQLAMFKSMTKSLSIPHFLFSDSVNVTALAAMRKRLNASREANEAPKFTYLPFIIKAVSLVLDKYPILNGRLDTASDGGRPSLVLRSSHNIGIAVDTPAGLLVPVIKNVNARSITSIAQEITRLAELGQAGKLSSNDLSGGTITVSNIGNIGGEVVAPVIVEGQLAILGIGKVKPTPVFGDDGNTVRRADLMSTNWSADHRIVDGATMARAARVVQRYLEQPESMMVAMS